jgi:hypothetical protein
LVSAGYASSSPVARDHDSRRLPNPQSSQPMSRACFPSVTNLAWPGLAWPSVSCLSCGWVPSSWAWPGRPPSHTRSPARQPPKPLSGSSSLITFPSHLDRYRHKQKEVHIGEIAMQPLPPPRDERLASMVLQSQSIRGNTSPRMGRQQPQSDGSWGSAIPHPFCYFPAFQRPTPRPMAKVLPALTNDERAMSAAYSCVAKGVGGRPVTGGRPASRGSRPCFWVTPTRKAACKNWRVFFLVANYSGWHICPFVIVLACVDGCGNGKKQENMFH